MHCGYRTFGVVLCWPNGWVESSVYGRRRVMAGFFSGGAAVHVSNRDIGIFIDWSCVGCPVEYNRLRPGKFFMRWSSIARKPLLCAKVSN